MTALQIVLIVFLVLYFTSTLAPERATPRVTRRERQEAYMNRIKDHQRGISPSDATTGMPFIGYFLVWLPVAIFGGGAIIRLMIG